MQYIRYMGEINDAKKRLAHSLGNLTEITKILKNLSLSDSVDLLFYNKEKSHFYDKINRNIILISYLEEGNRSIIGKAYLKKSPCNTYVHYDTHYNVSLDNPYKLNISAQIIFPVVHEEVVIGIIRLSKFKYTFEQGMVDILNELRGSLNDIFSVEIYNKAEENYETLFSLKKCEVEASLRTIHEEFTKLITYAHNPEIKKLIQRAEDNVSSVDEYIKIKLETLNKKQIVEEKKSFNQGVRVLIADDVYMNVKILYSMMKNGDNLDIHFAYDGIEALDKIEQAHKEEKEINILFLDHYMPGKLGLEVAKSIREREKNSNNTKTVIVSITNDPSAIEKEESLYDYHLPKPFVKSDLINVMNQIQNL